MSIDLGAALEGEGMGKRGEEPEIGSIMPVRSLESVKPIFLQYVGQVDIMVRDAKALEITDPGSLKFAVALGGEAKKIAKAVEARRKETIAEAEDFVKSVNGFCRLFTDKLVLDVKKSNTGCVENILKLKILDYQYKVELERREQEARVREAAEALQKKLQAEAEEINRKAREEAIRKAEEEAKAKKASEAEIEEARKRAAEEAKKKEISAPTVLAPVIPQEEKITRTESGTSSYQAKRWTCTVIDPAQVPREYCTPSKTLLDNAVTAGVREILGCKIEEIKEIKFRT